MNRAIQIFALCTFFYAGSAQNAKFSDVDSFAISVGKADSLSIQELTTKLTAGFSSQVLKTRSIYTWIASNISYDCPAFHNESKRKSDPKDVFKLRKGVCSGFANLFQTMCSDAGIQCLTIDGFARNSAEAYQDETPEVNHTWNAVRIDGAWHLVDVTWSGGYTDKRVTVFTKEFNDVYFFPSPERFLLNHYPVIDAWHLCNTRLSKKEFYKNPVILGGYLYFELSSFEPHEKTIHVKQSTPQSFSFRMFNPDLIHSVVIMLGEEKKAKEIKPEFSTTLKSIDFNMTFDKPGLIPMTIYLNSVATMIYQVDVGDK
jgi:Transglutaminase-like superfamily